MTQTIPAKINPYPFYSPRFWAGMKFSDYLGLLAEGRFRIHPARYAMALLVGGCAGISSALSLVQSLAFRHRIDAVPLQPPVFVIGHWRSGTTLLHELLSLDQYFTYPTTFQCFVPNHFLVSRRLLEPLVRLLMPATRPMDAMPAGARLPQEDEFALVGMGAPSPYRFVAFCNQPPPHLDMLDLEGASEKDIESVHQSLVRFYKMVSLQNPGRLVIKSPTHTGRIAELARWFPGAKFVHIARHPHKIVPSTIHLWRSLASVQGYQFPGRDDGQLESYVHTCYERMYNGYFRDRAMIPGESLLEIQFEELVKDPLGNVRNIYQSFDLPGFETVLPKLEQYWDSRRNHKTNPSLISPGMRATTDRRWTRYRDAFGYQMASV
jgi:hypothetical protein